MYSNDEILFAKIRELAIVPSKRVEDGAFDIYACLGGTDLIVHTGDTVKIPTGIISAFSPDYVAILKERGSTGTHGIGQRAGVIDSGYRGEWMVPITNHNDIPLIITNTVTDITVAPYVLAGATVYPKALLYPVTKAITSCIMVEVPKLHTKEVTADIIKAIPSERGEGAWGSSGK